MYYVLGFLPEIAVYTISILSIIIIHAITIGSCTIVPAWLPAAVHVPARCVPTPVPWMFIR